MKFRFRSDAARCLKPGERIWACGFQLDATCRRVIFDLKPTLCEVCCQTDPVKEPAARKFDGMRYSRVAIPVDKNGNLAWNRPRQFTMYLDVRKTLAESKAAYQQYLTAAQDQAAKAHDRICDIEDGIKSRLEKL